MQPIHRSQLKWVWLVLAISGAAWLGYKLGVDKVNWDRPAATNRPTASIPTRPETSRPALPPGSCRVRGVLPDPECTPGVASSAVTQANIKQTLCSRNYSASVRPPRTYTDRLKARQMREYGFTDASRLHEEDHLIPIGVGGDPRDPRNLWPEPDASPNPKDDIESQLHTAVCAGRISLKEAQTRIATNWTTAANGL